MARQAGGVRGIEGGRPHRIPQTPVGKLCYIADGAIHGEDASGEAAIRRTLPVFYVDFDWAELVAAVGHAGG